MCSANPEDMRRIIRICNKMHTPVVESMFSKTPEEWLPVFFKIHEINDAHDQDVYKRMVAKVLADTIYCTLIYDGKPAAASSAAIENSYMLLQNVIVAKEYRGLGLGKKVCAALLEKARVSGAHQAPRVRRQRQGDLPHTKHERRRSGVGRQRDSEVCLLIDN